MDSIRHKKLLTDEIEGNPIGEIEDWAVFDKKQSVYQTHPIQQKKLNYAIDLFTTGVLDPGRYLLQISLSNSDKINSDIWKMILLSVLFLLIISFVFAYSIRLVIRHKKYLKSNPISLTI